MNAVLNRNNFLLAIGIVFLYSIFLLPSFSLISGFPKISVSDILTPFFLIAVLLNINLSAFNHVKKMTLPLAFLSIIVVVSLIANDRLYVLRDVFELFKYLKFIVVFLFVYLFAHQIGFEKHFRIIFILLLLFNLLHYTDLFSFNNIVEVYYGSEIQVSTFGLNSLGEPDTKRILGTMGNPNNNAILFLFFVILFFPKSKSRISDIIYFLLAVLALFACQSRTGFATFIIVFIIGCVMREISLRNSLMYTFAFGLIYLLIYLLGNSYMGTFGNITKQGSVRGRIETWKMLWQMIKIKPILGFSPFKDYFYDNKIYAESEYFLITWRYGFIGLIAHLAWILTGALHSFRLRTNDFSFFFFLFTIVILVTGLTNVPLSDSSINMIYALSAGLFFSEHLLLKGDST